MQIERKKDVGPDKHILKMVSELGERKCDDSTKMGQGKEGKSIYIFFHRWGKINNKNYFKRGKRNKKNLELDFGLSSVNHARGRKSLAHL